METLRFAVKSGGYDAIASATNPIDIVNGGGDITINRDSTFWPHRYYVRIYRGALQPEWGPRVEGEESVGMHLLLEDSNRTAIQSTDLPLTPPDLNDFTSTGVNLFFGNDGYDDASAAVAVTLTSLSLGRSPQAQIDVIPGSASNEVSPVSDDAVPVAILGSDTFGVGQVDLSTLAFGRAKASPLGTPPPEVTDVNGDGFLDLVAYYRGDEAGIDLDDRAACLEGERLDGSFFQGCDAMTPVYPSVPILPPGLYGVTGDGASLPEALFMLDRGDATPSFAALLGRNRGGETIGFDPDDGLLYRASGQVFEAIDPANCCAPTAVALSGDDLGLSLALTYAGGGEFLLADQWGDLFGITDAGVVRLLGYLDHKSKGLAFVDGRLYSIENDDPYLYEVDPSTAATLGSVPISLPDETVFGGNGLASDPTTGQLWAVVRTSGDSVRELVTIDPTTGAATSVGDLGDRFAGLAFIPGATTLEVDVDIKPGAGVNAINPKSRGVIPVAILGSESFDVGDVDATTLAFGPACAPIAHQNGPHVKDANHDGIDDLLVHFLTQESGIAPGDEEACVTGELLDGTPFEGCDSIRTVPPR